VGQQKSDQQYVLKVNLKGNRRIWRLLVLSGDQTLDDLHETIYIAFDRDDEHLYSFYFPRAATRRDKIGFQSKEYASPITLEEPDPINDEKPLNAARAKLDKLNLEIGQTFEYLFDFGDMWWHELKVIGIEPRDPKLRLPMVKERHGESPQQYPSSEE
jgi:hypothetical protein